ncbi:two-component system, chemotaxis family, response regulator CheY [Desulfuromusa kysingii]|uniref:Two-component system, chemotaxis family, response regulator CheY n=1 Tax=Desulfuromusa kysingii TaxID=37625 RepID=A0A1H4BH93_9BACT|nr:response regulator [Desulfuromusa kysingii]SEA47595.1 two-component system, chemotaxis family, response regulator CheY [Desulfuromusa kysingii]
MHQRKVLVVDDSPTMRQFIVLALKRLPDLSVDEADNGVAALKQLSSKKYDLLLTDVNMPIMDGLKLVSLIRNDVVNADLPVVVITTEGSEMTRERALQSGASEFVTKPLQTARLIEVVRRLLDPEMRH